MVFEEDDDEVEEEKEPEAEAEAGFAVTPDSFRVWDRTGSGRVE